MPEERAEQKFRRDAVEGSRLQYFRRMIHFYEYQLDELSCMIGEKTEYNVTVTNEMLEKIEERLSDFEEKEKELIDNYRKLARKVEGVAV